MVIPCDLGYFTISKITKGIHLDIISGIRHFILHWCKCDFSIRISVGKLEHI